MCLCLCVFVGGGVRMLKCEHTQWPLPTHLLMIMDTHTHVRTHTCVVTSPPPGCTGMGIDKSLHRITLPHEGQVWAGIKGRVHKSSLKVHAHARPEGAISMAVSKQLIVTGSADGGVATHNMQLTALGGAGSAQSGEPTKGGLHDAVEGGVVAVTFDYRWD